MKFPLIVFVWAFALFLSFGLRFWGIQHPEPFIIRPFIVWLLLFGPSVFLGCYLVLFGFQNQDLT
ncbi:hypothetical protein EV05_0405 [Prochlorococcus sp. MIT 0601]|nr:hypothetical protein EV05_0405 [Prochlorococcus sp. MIT 0601]